MKTACPMRRGRRGYAGGFTYLGLLVLVTLIGVLLAAAGEVASTSAQRERETELLFIGHQFRDAIASFYRHTGHYPFTLEELVTAPTQGPAPAHFLRRVYRDPMTREANWIILPGPGGGVMGVASASQRMPLKRAGFDDVDPMFDQAQTYSDWNFVFDPRPPLPAGQSPAATRGAGR